MKTLLTQTTHQTYRNTPAACQQLRETYLRPSNWNNENPLPDFKSFVIMGNTTDGGQPRELLLYPHEHMTIDSKPIRAMLTDNGCYSFFRV